MMGALSVFAVVIPTLIVLFAVGAIAVLIHVMRNKEKDKLFNIHDVINTYLYIVMYIILLVVGGNIANLISYLIGNVFQAAETYPMYEYGRMSSSNSEVITSLITILLMGFLGLVHFVGLKAHSKKYAPKFASKMFYILSLATYAVLSLIFIPVAIQEATAVTNEYASHYYGYALSWLIVTMPLWVYYLVKLVGVKED